MKYISLTKDERAIVDDDDYVIVSRMKWFVQVTRSGIKYAATYLDKKLVSMHRFITNAPKRFDVDHRNGNGLDNRKTNLRACSHSQNLSNRKLNKNNKVGFKGVSLSKNKNRFMADIRKDGKTIHLGSYKTALEAAAAYDIAAIEQFGEYARTNVVLGLLN